MSRNVRELADACVSHDGRDDGDTGRRARVEQVQEEGQPGVAVFRKPSVPRFRQPVEAERKVSQVAGKSITLIAVASHLCISFKNCGKV